jgi:hypothetical protein
MSNQNRNSYIKSGILFFKDPENPLTGYTIPTIQDPLREKTGNYWTQESGSFATYGDMKSWNDLGRARGDIDLDLRDTDTSAQDTPKTAIKKVDNFRMIHSSSLIQEQNSFPYYALTQSFTIFSDKINFASNPTEWVNLIKETVRTGSFDIFSDYSFDILAPLAQNELDFQNYGKGSVYNKAEFEYNFYSRVYEQSIADSETFERFLPNLYNFLSYKKTISKEEGLGRVDDKIFQALTAGGQIEENVLNGFKVYSATQTNIDYFSYFDRFGQAKSKLSVNALQYMKNIAFDIDADDLRKEADKYKTVFPMYVNLEFASAGANQFSQVLKDSKLTKEMLSYVSNEVKLFPDYVFYSEKMKRTYEEYTLESYHNRGPLDATDGLRRGQASGGRRGLAVSSLVSEDVDVGLVDLGVWISQVFKGSSSVVGDNILFLRDEDGEVKELTPREKALYLIIFSGKLKGIMREHLRSFIDITEGKKAYTETVFYQIQKTTSGGAPVQNFWLPNTNELEVMKYIDTQVKYDTDYTYKVFAHQLVIGTEYKYFDLAFPEEYDPTDEDEPPEDTDPPGDSDLPDDPFEDEPDPVFEDAFGNPTSGLGFIGAKPRGKDEKTRPEDAREKSTQERIALKAGKTTPISYYDSDIYKTDYANRLFVGIRNKTLIKSAAVTANNFIADMKIALIPTAKIAVVPLFEANGRLIDDPPVPPEVKIIPYKDVKDKVLFNFNSSVGSYRMRPVTFSEKEKETVDKIRETKKLRPFSPITFTTDDRVAQFEIYRLTSPPSSIQDFRNSLLTTITTDVNPVTQQKASSAAYVDQIQPNVDYYYTFRATDIHENKSNPSAVYRVRLVTDGDAAYPLINVYDLEEMSTQADSKSCKKLLNITPNIMQTFINDAKTQPNIDKIKSAHEIKSLVIGSEDEFLFGKEGRTFKVRVTSKKTGKQIDLNVTFKVELVNN